MDDDPLRFVARIIDDLDLTRLHDEELEVAVADGEKLLPVLERPRDGSRATAQSSDLGLVEGREGDGLEIVFGHASVPGGWDRRKGDASYCKVRHLSAQGQDPGACTPGTGIKLTHGFLPSETSRRTS